MHLLSDLINLFFTVDSYVELNYYVNEVQAQTVPVLKKCDVENRFDQNRILKY